MKTTACVNCLGQYMIGHQGDGYWECLRLFEKLNLRAIRLPILFK